MLSLISINPISNHSAWSSLQFSEYRLNEWSDWMNSRLNQFIVRKLNWEVLAEAALCLHILCIKLNIAKADFNIWIQVNLIEFFHSLLQSVFRWISVTVKTVFLLITMLVRNCKCLPSAKLWKMAANIIFLTLKESKFLQR